MEAALKTNRKLALLGRSMVNVVAVALERGYLNVPDGMLIDAHEINQFPPEKVVILCTGSQGEPMLPYLAFHRSNYRDVDNLPWMIRLF